MAPKKTGATKAAPRKKTSAARAESPSVNVKPQKPMFRAGTWIALLLLAVLIGFTFYTNREKETSTDATPANEEISYVFAATEGIVSSIDILPANADAQPVKMARNAENVWALKLPLETEADQGLVEAAATQLSALRVISSIDGNPDVFGLDSPTYTITIEFAGGKKHTLEIGDSTPTNSGYYVRVDKDKMLIASLSGIDSLLQLVYFPPYLNTPTPTPLPSPTETPAPPTATATPEASVTPTP